MLRPCVVEFGAMSRDKDPHPSWRLIDARFDENRHTYFGTKYLPYISQRHQRPLNTPHIHHGYNMTTVDTV